MYNELIKENFIKNINISDATANAYRLLFIKISEYEQKFNKNIYEMTDDEVTETVNNITGMNIRGKKTQICLIRRYVSWCCDNHIPGAHMIIKNDYNGIEKITTRTVRNPMHMDLYLNSVFRPVEERTIDNIYRMVLWMAYSGMPSRYVCNVDVDDISFDDMSISADGNNYPIYREALPVFKSCVRDVSFVYKHPLHDDMEIQRVVSTKVARGFRDITYESIKSIISRRIKEAVRNGKTDIELSYYRATISGLFYRTYEKEMSGIKIDIEEESKNYIAAKLDKINACEMTGIRLCRLKKSYKDDYTRWKDAIGI